MREEEELMGEDVDGVGEIPDEEDDDVECLNGEDEE